MLVAAAATEMARRFAAGGRMFAFGNGGSSTDVATLVALFARPPFSPPSHPPVSRSRPGHSPPTRRSSPRWATTSASTSSSPASSSPGPGRGDIAVAMSTSGSSRDLMAGFREAHARGMYTVGFAGLRRRRVRGVARCGRLLHRPQPEHPPDPGGAGPGRATRSGPPFTSTWSAHDPHRAGLLRGGGHRPHRRVPPPSAPAEGRDRHPRARRGRQVVGRARRRGVRRGFRQTSSATAPCSPRRASGWRCPPTPSSCAAALSGRLDRAPRRARHGQRPGDGGRASRAGSPRRSSSRRAFRSRSCARSSPTWRAAAEAAGVQIVTGDTKVVPRRRGRRRLHHDRGRRHHPGGPGVARDVSSPATRCCCPAPSATTGWRSCSPAATWTSTPTSRPTPPPCTTLVERLCWRPRRRRGGCATRPAAASARSPTSSRRRPASAWFSTSSRSRSRRRCYGACDMLGIDPLYVANEGKFARRSSPPRKPRRRSPRCARTRWARGADRRRRDRPRAAATLSSLRTAFGGTRIVDMLVGDPLPRIC